MKKIHNIRLRAFLFGLVFRVILELINGRYPVGYDTNTHYVLKFVKMNLKEELAYGFLYQYMMFFLGKLIGDVLLAIKIIACMLSGLLIYTLYLWGEYNGLDRRDAFRFAILCYLYFTVLRIMWDLHRNVLGLILAMMAIIKFKKSPIIAYLLAILAGFAHPWTIFVIGPAITFEILKRNRKALVLLACNSSTLLIAIYCRKVILRKTVIGYSTVMGQTWYCPPALYPLYIVYLFGLLLPIVVIKARDIIKSVSMKDYNAGWLLSIVIAPLFVFGYRITLMASIPLLLIIFKSVRDSRRLMRLLAMICIVSSILYQPLAYMYPPFSDFRYTIGPTPFGSTFAPWDVRDIEALFAIVKQMMNKSTELLLHHSEISVAYVAGVNITRENVLIMHPDRTFDYYLDKELENYELVFIVWYIQPPPGSVRIPDRYKYGVVRRRGNFAIYMYFSKLS